MAEDTLQGFVLDGGNTETVTNTTETKTETPEKKEETTEATTETTSTKEEKTETETSTETTAATTTETKTETELTDEQKEEDKVLQDLIAKKKTANPDKTDEEIIEMLEKENPEPEPVAKIGIDELLNEFHSELGWDVPKDKMPELTGKGLVDYVKDIVSSNSKPAFASDLTENFNSYVSKGGDPKVWLDTIVGAPDYSEMKVESEAQQKYVATQYYKEKNPLWNAQKVEEKVEDLKDKEMLETETPDMLAELQRMDTEAKKNLEPDQDAKIVKEKKKYDDYVSDVTHKINTSDKIAGFEVTDNIKERFVEYLFKKDESGKSEYSKKLNDQKHNLELAFLSFKGINAEALKVEATTEATREMKNALARYKQTKDGKGATVKEAIGKPTIEYDDFVLKQN